jgi:hypothetical protein
LQPARRSALIALSAIALVWKQLECRMSSSSLLEAARDKAMSTPLDQFDVSDVELLGTRHGLRG